VPDGSDLAVPHPARPDEVDPRRRLRDRPLPVDLEGAVVVDVAVGVEDAAVAVVGELVEAQVRHHGELVAGPGDGGVRDAGGNVDNDRTLEIYGQMAVARAAAGGDLVGPGGMMDGQVGAIRHALDAEEHKRVGILAYSAKYASAFFGPFREAVDSSLEGDRRTYQQNPGNRREGVREALIDVEEGADLVMVKPALGYLDVVSAVADAVDVPVAAYNISGEYSMVEAAAANGWIDRDAAVLETLLSIRRAGADVILTYWALDAARMLRD
jgi:porphobilinogen synthase